MKTKQLPILFLLESIRTDEFAMIEEAFDEKNEQIQYTLESGFAIPEEEAILCTVGFKFIQNQIPFIKIKISCAFKIEKASWDSVADTEQKQVVFPTEFTDHIAALTVGTLRGVLHAKTEGTKFNRFFLLTVNITELRKDMEHFSMPLPLTEESKL